MPIDKRHLLQQLHHQYEQRLANARRAELDAREAARTMATESEKKEDGRVAHEFGNLANGQAHRSLAARAELNHVEALLQRKPAVFSAKSPVAMMALVDVVMTHEDGAEEERTFFVLPVGAGAELTGPGGDGFMSVVTPASPVGKALLGKRAGEQAEVMLKRGLCELRVLEVA